MNRQPTYCSRCGGPLGLQQRDGRERPVCSVCGDVVYLNPAPSVAAILFREGRVLLVRRSIEPGLGHWCLPGGFVEWDETVAEAVIREVREETGLLCRPTALVDVRAVLGGFYGDILVICYVAEIERGTLEAGEDAAAAAFFDPAALPILAFPEHLSFLETHLGRRLESGDA